jgi:hypothetical protein
VRRHVAVVLPIAVIVIKCWAGPTIVAVIPVAIAKTIVSAGVPIPCEVIGLRNVSEVTRLCALVRGVITCSVAMFKVIIAALNVAECVNNLLLLSIVEPRCAVFSLEVTTFLSVFSSTALAGVVTGIAVASLS